METNNNSNQLVMGVMTTIYQLMILNIMFIVTSLPIITLGASTKALMGSIRDLCKQELSSEMSTYFSYFKTDFKKSTSCFLILFVIYGIIALNFSTLRVTGWAVVLIQIPILIQLVITHFMVGYVLLEWDLTIKKTLKVAWVLGNREIVKIIGCIGIGYFLLKISMYIPFVIIFFYVSLFALIQYFFCYSAIRNLKESERSLGL